MTTPESVQQANESVATKLLDLLLFGRAPQPTRERFVLRINPTCPMPPPRPIWGYAGAVRNKRRKS